MKFNRKTVQHLVSALAVVLFINFAALAQKPAKIQLNRSDKNHRVDIVIDGQPFTSYFYPGETVLKKAVLYPIRTAKGTLITRGWPLDPRPGERVDHPHHVGMWLNYEDVNGYDYWNNSTSIIGSMRNRKFGTVRHTGIKSLRATNGKGELVVTADWVADDGKGPVTLKEETMYVFSGSGDLRTIDRITTLTAVIDVNFKDVKDGMVAIRVARELEHPAEKADVFTDASGVETKVPKLDNTGVVGSYRSSEGVQGEAVWSKRAKWMNLRGKIGNEDISLAILDHPANVGYPTYWHARGYGLYAANPLGQAAFTNGKENLNYSLPAGKSVTFRYRVLINSGPLSDETLNAAEEAFSKEVK
ncbi:MAG: PmoA family protein [Cytophagaceae bacterium]|nr:PmoA family protein [Cytophagaceae bacterium]